MLSQLRDSMSPEEDYERQPSALEDLFDGSPAKPSASSSNSRWVTLDVDLPLRLRGSASRKGSAPSASATCNATMLFEDASLRPMPLNPSLDTTVVLSTSTNAEEAEELDLPEIAFLSAASLELLVLTQTSMPDPQVGIMHMAKFGVCRLLLS
ncbi:unnamed protein product [Strongylus vulgaris]|uniref:Uncharacterized protein n=1 Tax=Strongylus vulgaris TaxID=40348 RepID=A0A3P7LZ22_STRVU|nr:unnamed protein product [Strongylus vulgaris]